MSELESKIESLASVPVLLVASDYDGTLSPIVSDPSEARPNRDSLVAIRSLANMPQTFAAIISGRSLRDLACLTGDPQDVHLVGSHGSEFDPGFASSLSHDQKSLRDTLLSELREIASSAPGLSVEAKPASIAFHYRNAEASAAEDAVERVMAGPASLPDVQIKRGKMVIELGVIPTDKGTALEHIRHRVGASAVLFVGDDVTDEDAFSVLRGPDIGLKVGPGETAAAYRVDGTDDVARVLAHIAEARSKWLTGSGVVEITHHSLLSDHRTVALVTPEARVTWACLPRIDSPALFAELLGGPSAGYFSVRPAENSTTPEQVYTDSTMVLETRWPSLRVVDFLDCSAGRQLQRAGRTDLVRIIEGGAVVEFAPRLDFGRVQTRLAVRKNGLEIEDSLDPVVLVSPGVEWKIERHGQHDTAIARIDKSAGPVVLELRYGTGSTNDGAVAHEVRQSQTERYWSEWAGRLQLPEFGRDHVLRSALVLKALCYSPTGAVAAAGTTSLPEYPGGVRNWDYRYCWPRDGALSCQALVRLGSSREALRFLDWILGVLETCESPERLSPVYTVSGGMLGPEAEIAELSGYAGSRPVRVGNAASRQVQLDVFGPIAELIWMLIERGEPVSAEHWRVVEAMVEAVQARWRDKDHGIWEVRRPRQHHVHSKVMCWLTVDRALAASREYLGKDRPAWVDLRDEIASDILEQGWHPKIDCFQGTYNEGVVDASALHVGLSGMIKADDERFIKTVNAVERELLVGPTVYRYLYDDGLPGREGGFHLCTTWLIEAYAMVERLDDAKKLFDEYVALAGPTGLLSEEYEPRMKRGLGNHPQAYSHLGLISAALRIAEHMDS